MSRAYRQSNLTGDKSDLFQDLEAEFSYLETAVEDVENVVLDELTMEHVQEEVDKDDFSVHKYRIRAFNWETDIWVHATRDHEDQLDLALEYIKGNHSLFELALEGLRSLEGLEYQEDFRVHENGDKYYLDIEL